MAALDRPAPKARPVYLNLFAIRLPLPGFVSILHRISGALLFLIGIPLALYIVQQSLASAEGWAHMRAALSHPLAKLVLVLLAWAYFHHFIAGVRHLWMDATHSVTKEQGHSSAIVTLAASAVLTIVLGAKLFGLF